MQELSAPYPSEELRDPAVLQKLGDLLDIQAHSLEMIQLQATLPQVLRYLAGAIQEMLPFTAHVSVMTRDPQSPSLRCVAAPSLPAAFIRDLQTIPVGQEGVCCGLSTSLGKPVIVDKVAEHSLDPSFRQLFLLHGVQACWSFPLTGNRGSLNVYLPAPGRPDEATYTLLSMAARSVAIVGERHQKREQRPSPQRENNRNFFSAEDIDQLALSGAGAGTFYIHLSNDTVEYSPSLPFIITGREQQTISRQLFVDYLHPDDRPLRDKAYEAGALTGKIEYEARFIWHDGSIHYIRVSGKYSYDEEGKPVSYSGIAWDITREWTIRNEELKLLSLVENSNDFMGIADLEGRINYINQKGRSLLGIAPEGTLSNLVNLDLYDPNEHERINNQVVPDLMQKGRWSGTVMLKHQVTGELIPFHADYILVRDHFTGAVIARGGTLKDLRPSIESHKALVESEQRFRSILEQAPIALGVLKGEDFIVESANAPLLQIWGREASAISKPILEVLPEIADQPFPTLLRKVLHTGEPVHGDETGVWLKRNGRLEQCFFNFVYAPYHEYGRVTGVYVVATEVTAQVLTKKELEESEKRFRNLVLNAPVATAVYYGRDFVISLANEAMISLWGKDSSVVGQRLDLALPELEGQPFFQLLDQVFTSGKAYTTQEAPAHLLVDGRLQTFYFNYTYKPLKDASGSVYAILNMAMDVTSMVHARRKLEEAEAYFKRMTDTVPTMIWMTDASGHATYLNQQWYVYTGQTEEEAAGTGWLNATHPDDMDAAGKAFLKAVETRSSFRFTYRLRDRQGGYRWFIDIGHPRFDEAGVLEGYTGSVLDIDEAKQAQESLEAAEERLRLAAESTGIGTWDLDLVTRSIIYSPTLNEIFGTAPGQVMTHQQMRDRLHAEDRELIVEQAFEKALQTGIYHYEARVSRPDGEIRWIRTQGKIITRTAEGPQRMVGTMIDITEQKKALLALEESEERFRNLSHELELRVTERTADLQQANANLERSNAELAQYAFIASHDLQEPLRKIRVFSGLIQEKANLAPDSANALTKVMSAAERMSNLINDLLEFSRLLKDGTNQVPVNLNEIVHEVINDFELPIIEKNVTIRLDSLPLVSAVPLQMNQLFCNLVSNALKFMKTDVPPLIVISSKLLTEEERTTLSLPQTQKGYYAISVRDNGIGFPPSFAEQIFEIFKRLHAHHSYPGTGIGLAVCRKIAENHGGTLYARAQEGEGAEFVIVLPR